MSTRSMAEVDCASLKSIAHGLYSQRKYFEERRWQHKNFSPSSGATMIGVVNISPDNTHGDSFWTELRLASPSPVYMSETTSKTINHFIHLGIGQLRDLREDHLAGCERPTACETCKTLYSNRSIFCRHADDLTDWGTDEHKTLQLSLASHPKVPVAWPYLNERMYTHRSQSLPLRAH